MNTSTLALAALALAASSAQAGYLPYRVLTMDFGGVPHGTLGQPITWQSSGSSRPYRHPMGTLAPPTADLIDAVPAVRWDDYLMFDPIGPSDAGDPSTEGDGHTALAASGGIATSIDAGRIVGMQYAVGATGGRYAGADGRLYFASITLPTDASPPETSGIYIGLLEDNAPSEAHIIAAKFGPESAVFGAEHHLPSPRATSRRYFLDWIATPVPASALTGDFGPAINYTLYIQQEGLALPTPGAAGLLGLALLSTARRRR